MQEFLDNLIGSPNTRKTYKSLFINYIQPVYELRGNDIFSRKMLRDAIEVWESYGLSHKTIKSIIQVMNRFAKHLGVELDTSEVKYVLTPQAQHIVKALSYEEAQQVLSWAKTKDHEIYAAVVLGMHAGLRISETLSLKVEDTSGEWITVGQSFVTKNRQGRRIKKTPLVTEVINNLHRTSGKLFTISAKSLNKALKEMGITYHTLRHTFATLALNSGVSVKLVQQALGHKSLQTTLDVYWNMSKDGLTNFSFVPEGT